MTETQLNQFQNGAVWQQAYAAELRQDDANARPRLRVSGAAKCVRRQYYAGQGVPETNRADRQGRNRMALGHAIEALIVARLKEDGWETAQTCVDEGQLSLSVSDPELDNLPAPVSGHPDGLCRHPRHTQGRWLVLECKSMSVRQADRILQDGIAAVYPEYMTQIALYAMELRKMNRVATAAAGVFAMMDRDGRSLPRKLCAGAWITIRPASRN